MTPTTGYREALMQQAGRAFLPSGLTTYADEGHMLFFSHAEEILAVAAASSAPLPWPSSWFVKRPPVADSQHPGITVHKRNGA